MIYFGVRSPFSDSSHIKNPWFHQRISPGLSRPLQASPGHFLPRWWSLCQPWEIRPRHPERMAEARAISRSASTREPLQPWSLAMENIYENMCFGVVFPSSAVKFQASLRRVCRKLSSPQKISWWWFHLIGMTITWTPPHFRQGQNHSDVMSQLYPITFKHCMVGSCWFHLQVSFWRTLSKTLEDLHLVVSQDISSMSCSSNS